MAQLVRQNSILQFLWQVAVDRNNHSAAVHKEKSLARTFIYPHRLIEQRDPHRLAQADKIHIYCGLMKYNGLLMDKSAMLEKQAEAEAKLAQLRGDIAFLIGDVDIGANASTAAFKRYLFKDLGLPVMKTTAKQQEAADDQAMILLAEWCREHRPDFVPLFPRF